MAEVKERPILFSGEMVRAILSGAKTQNRFICKLPHQNPLGVWEPFYFGGPGGGVNSKGQEIAGQWTISHTRTGEIHGCPHGQIGMSMPRWASRITLEITDVRVERLSSISEEDALAEGVCADPCDHVRQSCEEIGCCGPTTRGAYRALWESINGKGSWDANPWVWAISFRVLP